MSQAKLIVYGLLLAFVVVAWSIDNAAPPPPKQAPKCMTWQPVRQCARILAPVTLPLNDAPGHPELFTPSP